MNNILQSVIELAGYGCAYHLLTLFRQREVDHGQMAVIWAVVGCACAVALHFLTP